MYKMIVWIKFVKKEGDKTLTHSGLHSFYEPTLDLCYLAMEICTENFIKAGWCIQEISIQDHFLTTRKEHGRLL